MTLLLKNILITCIITDVGKFHPQIFLDEALLVA